MAAAHQLIIQVLKLHKNEQGHDKMRKSFLVRNRGGEKNVWLQDMLSLYPLPFFWE